MADPLFIAGMIVAAFAGGLFGAALGSLPSFIFTGFAVMAGEALRLGSAEGGTAAALGATGITGQIAFGAFFGPHIAFAGGAAASAYAAKKGYISDTNWGYHHGKNILIAFAGKHNDVLIVGGLFGVLGYLAFFASDFIAAPWDPVAFGVVLSAVAHRLFLGYDLIGDVKSDGILDMRFVETGETYETDGREGNQEERLLVEPWLPWQYKWSSVALIGFAAGILGGFSYWATASPYLAFGISAASLVFLNLGVYDNFGGFQVPVPVTHHMTLPASTAPMAYAGIELAGVTPAAVQAELLLVEAVLIGAIFGVIGALLGELVERIFYAHGDTHFDPPAASILLTTLLIAALAMLGLFPTAGWIPVPF